MKNELAKFIIENPDLEVVFMVDGSEMLCDQPRTAHRIESVDIDYIMDNDEGEYFVGEPDILDVIEHESGICFMEIADAMREMPGRIKKMIIVYTGAL